MYPRFILTELLDLAKAYPIVTINGPRQSGKTTVAKLAFPQKPYVNLEDPDARELAESDPRSFLYNFPDGAILDEIQRVPKLLSYIQVIVDREQKKGMFILTGSHQMELHQAISQSLAGRTALLKLLPLSLAEMENAGINLTVDQCLLKGGYPRIHHDGLNATKAYSNYFQTYVERDLRQLMQVKDLAQFHRFVQLLAGRIGQLVNRESLGNDVGISANTVKQWLSILEASYIIFQLQPYHENFGKRVVKTPKIYFTDVGLASYLLGIHTETQMTRDPLRGNLFENLIVLELVKGRYNQGLDPQLFFYRDSNGREVDVIFQDGHELIPIEIKSSATYSGNYLKSLNLFRDMAKGRSPGGYLIYAGSTEQTIHQNKLLTFLHASQAVLAENLGM